MEAGDQEDQPLIEDDLARLDEFSNFDNIDRT